VLVEAGVYRFWSKRVAFRNDYCVACDAQRLAVQVRSFYVGHVWWVPVLPLGFWKQWVCSACSRPPHVVTRTRRGFKVALIGVAILFALPIWLLTPEPGEVAGFWSLRLASVVLLAGSIWWATTGHRANPSLREGLARVQPYAARTCPFCGGYLQDQPSWHCPACAVERA
jgi:hypothetical protein